MTVYIVLVLKTKCHVYYTINALSEETLIYVGLHCFVLCFGRKEKMRQK